jgi:8-oxo-dGTP pyrophosphatase MutT (NUDIX family)
MEEDKDKKVLHSLKYFDVIQNGSMVGIEPSDITVVVMPFERDLTGLPKNLGILREYNPLRRGKYSKTLITGRTEDEDPDILATAMREMKEESGYDVADPERWCFLGFMTGSKLVDQEHPCFAVDITDLEPAEKLGDGSESERKSEFKVVTVKDALDSTDCYIPTLFLKMFKYIFNVSDFVKTEEGDIDVDAIRQELDKEITKLEGVNGSVVVTSEDGLPSIEYTVANMTDEIKNAIPAEYKGVKITTRVLNGEPGSAGEPGAGTEAAQGEEPIAGE